MFSPLRRAPTAADCARAAKLSPARAVTLPRKCRNVAAKMFTGIVQGQGEVLGVTRGQASSTLQVDFPQADGAAVGASVAINGTCLTITSVNGTTLTFDVIGETLRCTNLGALDAGSRVNFERSARIGDEIGGHNVSGHVQSVADITAVDRAGDEVRLTFRLRDSCWMKYIMPKGFIAVDGCSLTVGEVEEDTFSVYLIPETLRVTVFGKRAVGDVVNIEIDAQTQAIVNTVERCVEQAMAARER